MTLYVGWRNKRVSGEAYYEMMVIYKGCKSISKDPFALEDFGRDNAIYKLRSIEVLHH